MKGCNFQLPPVLGRHGSLEIGVDKSGCLCVQFRSRKTGKLVQFKCTSQYAGNLASQIRDAQQEEKRK